MLLSDLPKKGSLGIHCNVRSYIQTLQERSLREGNLSVYILLCNPTANRGNYCIKIFSCNPILEEKVKRAGDSNRKDYLPNDGGYLPSNSVDVDALPKCKEENTNIEPRQFCPKRDNRRWLVPQQVISKGPDTFVFFLTIDREYK